MSKIKIVIINGPPTSGKDTFCDQCKQIMRYYGGIAYSISTIDRIKTLAENEFGWDGHKDSRARNFLADFKSLLTKYYDLPYTWTCSTINQIQHINNSRNRNVVIFVHCREPEEIDKFIKHYGEDIVTTLLIDREVYKDFNNQADVGVYNYFYDCVIENNASLKELYASAITYLNYIFDERMENKYE